MFFDGYSWNFHLVLSNPAYNLNVEVFMNIFLWALQIILAIKLFTVTFNHGLFPDPVKMQRGRDRFGYTAKPLLILIAGLTFLTGLGLILPAMLSFLPWTASFTAFLMLIATGFHLRCRETPKIWVSLILFTLAALLAYGRWAISSS